MTSRDDSGWIKHDLKEEEMLTLISISKDKFSYIEVEGDNLFVYITYNPKEIEKITDSMFEEVLLRR